ncbi:MAG: hypothetical protein IKB97_02285 [Bacteroidaceae bacterium]|nr:hypothetical protein [Bacteroidaceae bacterium]
MKNLVRLFLFMTLIMSILHACKEPYQWLEVEDAIHSDKPKTALRLLEKMEQRAVAEKNGAQLLRIRHTMYDCLCEISPDSAFSAMQRMEELCSKEEDPVLKALWHVSLAEKYSGGYMRRFLRYKECEAKQAAHWEAAFSKAEVLAETPLKDYLSVLKVDKISKQNGTTDVLMFVFMEYVRKSGQSKVQRQTMADKVAAIYEKNGYVEAVLRVKLERTSCADGEEAVAELQEIAAAYEKLPLNIETYIQWSSRLIEVFYDNEEQMDSIDYMLAKKALSLYGKSERASYFENVKARIESAEVKHVMVPGMAYLGKDYEVPIVARNCQEVTLCIKNLSHSALEYEQMTISAKQRIKPKEVQRLVCRLQKGEPYHWQRDTLSLRVDEPGVYKVELLQDNEPVDSTTVFATRIAMQKAWVAGEDIFFTLVDGVSGAPLTDCKVLEYAEKNELLQVHRPTKGNAFFIKNTGSRTRRFVAQMPGDEGMPSFVLHGHQYNDTSEREDKHLDLFTDRPVYRPGQKVSFCGVLYTKKGDRLQTVGGKQVKVVMYDWNRKDIDSLSLQSDTFGNISGEFVLPAYYQPGFCILEASWDDQSSSKYIDVEEYKRPTFKVELSLPTKPYALGDTAVLTGLVETYTGVPLAGAEVEWTLDIENWGRMDLDDGFEETGRVTAGADGRFEIPVALKVDKRDSKLPYYRYSYTVDCKVTAENGESAAATQNLYVSTQPTCFAVEWPDGIQKENLPWVKVCRDNAAFVNQPGKVVCQVLSGKKIVAETTVETGKSFLPTFLKKLPSGKYKVRFCQPRPEEGENWETDFLLFSENDKRLVEKADFWYHVERENGNSINTVLIGSSEKDVHLHHYILTARGIEKSKHMVFSNSILRFPLSYQPQYGETALAVFVFRKNGKEHVVEVKLEKPRPNKELKMEWSSFRPLLIPGQQEEWRLVVKHTDGRPANASVIAGLYDKSLEKLFYLEGYGFGYSFYRGNLPDVWQPKPEGYNTLSSQNFYSRCPEETPCNMSFIFGGDPYFVSANRETMLYAAGAKDMAPRKTKPKVYNGELMEEQELRSNFSETAFFYPAVRTNAEGQATIAFTLPQSLTAWKFHALAHTENMDHGTLTAEVVSRKPFMAQGALPRFLREGDKTVLPVTLRNLTDKVIAGEVDLTLREADTEKIVFSGREKFSVTPQGSLVVKFSYEVKTAAPLLVCRIQAVGNGFSDGEEISLPVVSGAVSVTRSLPFSVTKKGSHTFSLAHLLDTPGATHRQLSVEISSHPVWNAVAALPALSETPCHSSYEWATHYYALMLGDYVANSHPHIKEMVEQLPENGMSDLLSSNFYQLAAETPWLREADNEQARHRALKNLFDSRAVEVRSQTAFDNLTALQNEDGSWSWFKGMGGNVYTTCDIAILLARLKSITGDERVASALQSAMAYLEKEVADDKTVKDKNVLPSEWHLRYLYLRHLMGLQPDAIAQLLLEKTARMNHVLTMFGKALSAVFLADTGYSEVATNNLQSLLEHTVATPEMGRYFDTDRALRGYAYAIPTQVAAIEALLQQQKANPKVDNSRTIEELRLWLLQSKRTQMWETSRATADALYILLAAEDKENAAAVLSDKSPLYFTLTAGEKIVGFNAASEAKGPEDMGYFCKSYAETETAPLWENSEQASLKVNRATDGLSWGSVKVSFVNSETEVTPTSAGLSLKRHFEVWREGTWQQLSSKSPLHIGERVRQVFEMTADRDYDFVELQSARPACLETTRAISGFTWQDGLACYRVVRDASTAYYFEKFAKGRHRFTEEYFVDRAGLYQCSLSTLRCVYAPEYESTTAALKVEVLP